MIMDRLWILSRKWRCWILARVESEVFLFAVRQRTVQLPRFLFHGSLSMQNLVRRMRSRCGVKRGRKGPGSGFTKNWESFRTRRWIIGIQTGESARGFSTCGSTVDPRRENLEIKRPDNSTLVKTSIERKSFEPDLICKERADPLRGESVTVLVYKIQRNLFREQ